MILLPIVLLGILPSCLYASSVYDAVPTFQNAAVVNRHGNGSHLNTLPQLQRELFDYAMEGLDANYGAPFLFRSVRYSAWYAVALLARNEGNDVKTASSLIKNASSPARILAALKLTPCKMCIV
ncbi:hypothetical protein QCA50_014562 [Cerrena zonata]|uniref:Sel1 repeat family protein n=1 Tax=Cerrena zonata TaxID=2478898 RepID=A0AAW0FQJ2_9APHY